MFISSAQERDPDLKEAKNRYIFSGGITAVKDSIQRREGRRGKETKRNL